jgi:hypothetical protein
MAKVMPDDHSEVVPLLPIPNRTVKRLCADDSAGSRVKVGHRQATISKAFVIDEGLFSCGVDHWHAGASSAIHRFPVARDSVRLGRIFPGP